VLVVQETVNIRVKKVQLIHQYSLSKKKENIILKKIISAVLLFFLISINPPRNIDLQLPDGGSLSRRGSYGSDTDSRLPSGNIEFY